MIVALAEVNAFLGRNHFIFLGISIALIVATLILLNKFKVPFKKVLFAMFIVMIISELIKINEYVVTYTNNEGNVIGAYFDKEGLPFHLCSIQIFFIFLVLVLKDGSFKEKLLAFMYPTCFIGAIFSLLLATVDIEFSSPLTWQFFMVHAALIIFGLYIPMSKVVVIDTKKYVNTCIVLIALFLVSVYINGITSMPSQNVIVNGEVVGITEGKYTSFFYSMIPPLEGLPILNMKYGWFVYALSIIAIGIIVLTLAHLPFIIKDIKKKKLEKQNIK